MLGCWLMEEDEDVVDDEGALLRCRDEDDEEVVVEEELEEEVDLGEGLVRKSDREHLLFRAPAPQSHRCLQETKSKQNVGSKNIQDLLSHH